MGWMQIGIIILSEESQAQKAKHCTMLLIRGI